MTAKNQFLEHVARAEVYLAEAGKLWDPTIESGCLDCAEALRLAVAEMEAACTSAGSGPAPEGVEARIGRFRSEVEQLARRVDAAMAFCRGLSLRSAGEETVQQDGVGVIHHV